MFRELESLFTKKLKILLHSNLLYFILFLFLLFYIFLFTCVLKYQTSFPEGVTEIIGRVKDFSIDGDKLSFVIEVKEKFVATYYIKSAEEKEELQKNLKIGYTLLLKGNRNEVLDNTIPNTFNYKKYLYHQKIYFSFSVSSIEIIDTHLHFFDALKNKVDARLLKLGNHPYLRAFIIGDKNAITYANYQNIMTNGVSHLFALSGMHLSLVYAILSKLLYKIRYKKVCIYLFLFLYLVVTGCSISFLRAILFMLFLDINKIFQLEVSKIKVLFLVAFFLLLWNPFTIYNLGFWYTFVVTFSLLFCNKKIRNKNKFGQVVFVSSITFLFSAPISIYMNYEINLFSIVNNILLVPFISTLVFPMAILSFLFPIFLPIFQFLIHILEGTNQILLHFSVPIIFGKISLGDVFLYYVILLLLLVSFSKKKVFLFFFFLFFLYHKDFWMQSYQVYFIDVGQGDSTLFVAPRNKEAILIDTGGKITYEKENFQIRNKEFSLADSIVLFLKSIRVRKIDLLLLTHGDFDHLGYASAIGKEIKIKSIMINKGPKNALEQQLIQEHLQMNRYSSKNFGFETMELKLYDNENDNSILTKIRIYDSTFLLMGDASKTVENDLLKKYAVKATFLKLGHHGSNTSSSTSFLKQVAPKLAIISSGRGNRYNHPSKETIKSLTDLSIPYLNTQDVGTIEIKINRKGYHIISTLS